jgi:hypothetical protein
MAMYKHSTMDTYFGDDEADHGYPCEVRIDNTRIVVSYAADGLKFVYEGEERGEGHFELRCAAENGRATLHRFADELVLEGWWVEGRNTGMWRIHLDDEP